ncbi:MAG: tRNA (adenosine(37)-N6)-threonylcarbamoyltransferase complex ATPase subunit type 1 TsaE [Rikenellaceae bacterium]
MTQKFKTDSLDDLKDVAEKVANVVKDEQTKLNIILFRGSMGAGKTTFIKYLCQFLDVTDVVTSPTFAIVNEYNTKSDEPIFHFDLYRIESIDELYQIGYEEYFYSPYLSLIEWPEKGEQVIPYDDPSVKIGELTINIVSNSDREIIFKY